MKKSKAIPVSRLFNKVRKRMKKIRVVRAWIHGDPNKSIEEIFNQYPTAHPISIVQPYRCDFCRELSIKEIRPITKAVKVEKKG